MDDLDNRMLARSASPATRAVDYDTVTAPSIDLAGTIRAVFWGMWRQKWLVGTVAFLLTSLGLVYALYETPVYTARASLLVDPRISNAPTSSVPAAPALLMSDQLVVDSEVQVLTSRQLSSRLLERVEAEGLEPNTGDSDEDEGTETGGAEGDGEAEDDVGLTTALAGRLRYYLGDLLGDPPQQLEFDEATTAQRDAESRRRDLIRPLVVERAGETYVIDVSYTSEDPVFAARVVNLLLDEYFLVQAQAVLDNTQRLNTWLSERVAALAEEVVEADAAVEAYRRLNDLYDVGNDETEELASRVELRAANEQLVTLRNETLDISAEIRQLEDAIANDNLNVSLEGELTTLPPLRTSLIEKRERARSLEDRLGPNHGLVQEAEAEVAVAEALIIDELVNITEQLRARRNTLESQAEAAQARIEALEVATSDNEELAIELRKLVEEAEAKRRLYTTLLDQLNETIQRESFQPTNARIIADAVPPDQKSAPNTKLIVVLAAFAGVVLGSGLAFLREELNDAFLRNSEVRERLGLDLIGISPLINEDIRQLRRSGVRPQKRSGRRFARHLARLRFAADTPRSMLAETLRTLDARLTDNLDQPGRSVVFGITSARKGEGKSTLSANFAVMKAKLGYRVALLDFDVRALGVTQAVRDVPKQNNLATLIADPSRLERIEPSAALSDVYVISPGRGGSMVLSDPETLRSIAALVSRLRETFDYIVIDLPPLSGLVDADVAAQLTEKMILAIEWGRANKQQLEHLLTTNGRVSRRLCGAVFTKVRLGAYSAYNGMEVHDYYSY